MGTRLPKCSSPSFPKKVEEALPAEVREALLPLVRLAEALSDCIKDHDERIEKLGREKYEHTELLRQVKSVGSLTSLAYVLTLENPDRFAKSRDVGPYLGLLPKQEDSGDSQPQLGISKAGDRMLRRLLVGSAHYILGPFGHRLTAVWAPAVRERREECEEACGGSGSAEIGCITAPAVGDRRSI